MVQYFGNPNPKQGLNDYHNLLAEILVHLMMPQLAHQPVDSLRTALMLPPPNSHSWRAFRGLRFGVYDVKDIRDLRGVVPTFAAKSGSPRDVHHHGRPVSLFFHAAQRKCASKVDSCM